MGTVLDEQSIIKIAIIVKYINKIKLTCCRVMQSSKKIDFRAKFNTILVFWKEQQGISTNFCAKTRVAHSKYKFLLVCKANEA